MKHWAGVHSVTWRTENQQRLSTSYIQHTRNVNLSDMPANKRYTQNAGPALDQMVSQHWTSIAPMSRVTRDVYIKEWLFLLLKFIKHSKWPPNPRWLQKYTLSSGFFAIVLLLTDLPENLMWYLIFKYFGYTDYVRIIFVFTFIDRVYSTIMDADTLDNKCNFYEF